MGILDIAGLKSSKPSGNTNIFGFSKKPTGAAPKGVSGWLGLGGGKGNVSGKYTPRKDKVTAGRFGSGLYKERKTFSKIGALKVIEKYKDKETGEMKTRTRIISKEKVAELARDIAKKNAGRTYSSMADRLKRNRGQVDYIDKKEGNVVHVKFGSSGSDIRKKKEFSNYFAGEKVSEIANKTPEEIRRYVKASNAVARMTDDRGGGMASGLSKGRSKENIKSKFENTTSDRITKEKVTYKIGDKEYTTNDLRGGRANGNSEQAHGFASTKEGDKATSIAAGTGVKNAEKTQKSSRTASGNSGSVVSFQAFKDGAVNSAGQGAVRDEHDDIGGEFGVGGNVVRRTDHIDAKQKNEEDEKEEPENTISGADDGVIDMFKPYAIRP